MSSLLTSLSRFLSYPAFSVLPELPPATAIHVNDGFSHATMLRVPMRLLKASGLDPQSGVNVATYRNRLLIWGTGPYKQDSDTKQFFLRKSAVSNGLLKGNLAFVCGPGYLVVTAADDTANFAGDVPKFVRQPQTKPTPEIITDATTEELIFSEADIIAWKDFAVTAYIKDRHSAIASVAGGIWLVAGLDSNCSLKFTKFSNATVIERGETSGGSSVVLKHCRKEGAGPLRYYVGPTIFPVFETKTVRAVASAGRVVLVKPDSALGQRCTEKNSLKAYLGGRRSPVALKIARLMAPSPAMGPSDIQPEEVFGWRDIPSSKSGALSIFASKALEAAGFRHGLWVRTLQYEDAVGLELTQSSEAGLPINGGANSGPKIQLNLNRTCLNGLERVRVLFSLGRIYLVDPAGHTASTVGTAKEWPTKARASEAFFKAVTEAREKSTARYIVPEQKRLQIQGKWLASAGFIPGALYSAEVTRDEIHIKLTDEGSQQVTQHSPGVSKLYVYPKTTKDFQGKAATVYARPGALRIAFPA